MAFLGSSQLSPERNWSRASAPLAYLPGPALSPENLSRLWLEQPTALLESCHRKYGDVFALQLGSFGTLVIIADPAAARQVFQAPANWFECRHFNESYRYVMGDNALFLQDGANHRRIKQIVRPQLRGDRLRKHPAEIVRVTREVIQSREAGGQIRLRPMIHEITLRCLLSIVFGERCDAREQVVEWFRAVVWRDMRSWKPWTRLSRLHGEMRKLLATELNVRRNDRPGGREPDLLDMLLAGRDEAGGALGDDEIQDQALMLTITVGDAVAVAASWALYRVAANPLVQSTIREECETLGEDRDAAQLALLPYLTATVQEVLRLHTVLPTVSGRRLSASRSFLGHQLDVGVMLAPCEYLIHRRADIFEEPLAFCPDRFLNRSYAPHEYFPFGGGQRSCLGVHLAPLTVKLVLATVLSQFRLAVTRARPPEVVRYGTLLAPQEDFALRFTPL